MPAEKKKPRYFSNPRAYAEGWGIFKQPNGLERIQRLADPKLDRPKACTCEPEGKTCCAVCRRAGFWSVPCAHPFPSDARAVAHVMAQAKLGSEYHKQAMCLHMGARRNKDGSVTI